MVISPVRAATSCASSSTSTSQAPAERSLASHCAMPFWITSLSRMGLVIAAAVLVFAISVKASSMPRAMPIETPAKPEA
jgi:hypothetical protein